MTEHRGAGTPAALAETYFAAWQAQDWAALRAVLADDATFRGPLGSAEDADACLAGLRRMAEVLERIDVRARLGDDEQVITWFDLHTSVAAPAPTANWMRTADGRIQAIRVAFDPRGLLAGLAAGPGADRNGQDAPGR